MKRLVVAMVLFFPLVVHAHGSPNKRLGLGVTIGEPIGFDTRLYLSKQFLADLVVGYGFSEEALIIQPSVLFALRDILDYDGPNYSVVPYFGAGFKTGVVVSGRHDGEGVAALRFPLGGTWIMKRGVFEASLEIGPGVEFNPENEFDFTVGVGLRYALF